MKRTKVLALLALLIFAAIIVALSLRNRKPPWIPADEAHAGTVAPQDCAECHAHDAPFPVSPDHPASRDCKRCHARR